MIAEQVLVHGSRNTYSRHNCRCQYCRAAYAIYRAAERSEQGVEPREQWWPTPRALYVCGVCGFTADVEASFTFTRAPHFCHNGDSARMVP